MSNRVLVAYATKAGATAQIAEKIRDILAQKGHSVDLQPLNKVSDLSPYQAVVIGSGIRVGGVLPEVKAFIEENKAALKQKSFSLFIDCMTLKENTDENRGTVGAYLEPIRAILKPECEGMFAGKVDLQKLPFFERMMVRMMKAPVGDFRDWDQISAWAESLPVS